MVKGDKMVCPKCQGETKVLNCASNDETTYRLRKCLKCKNLFMTKEQISEDEDSDKKTLYSLKKEKY
jgi:transcriptional regulator NrdR family protein